MPKSQSGTSIAVLVTCFNRRETTLSCIERLRKQTFFSTVYLVDDGSSDGTSDAIRATFPDVKIYSGDGNLYWAGGMRLAFSEALKTGHDYYLWLNDDTILFEDAIERLIKTHNELLDGGQGHTIVVGSVQDPATKKLTYGGRVKTKKLLSFKDQPVEPGSQPVRCDLFQGNIVLIPQEIAGAVGNIDSAFTHNFGDLDYAFRTVNLGYSIWIAPGYMGECPQNSVSGSWVDMSLSPIARLKKVSQIKNFPLYAWTTYVRRHAGFFWFLLWPLPYVRALIGYRDLDDSPTFSKMSSGDK